MMSAHYEQEQDANEEKLSELEKQHKAKSVAVTNAEQFMESLVQCVGMKIFSEGAALPTLSPIRLVV